MTKRRTQWLQKNNMALYACHLPLDAHHNYGNNIELARMLNCKEIKKFGKYHGFKIGYKGKTKATMSKIANTLNKKIRTTCQVHIFGKKQITSIGIVSVGGSDAIEDAVKEKLDVFVVGEISQEAYTRARDFKMNMIVAGHYATETTGVRALMPLIREKFNMQTVFIDNPTGV